MAGNRTESQSCWNYGDGEKPEMFSCGMKNLSRMEQGQTEPQVPVLGSGRPQSEIS